MTVCCMKSQCPMRARMSQTIDEMSDELSRRCPSIWALRKMWSWSHDKSAEGRAVTVNAMPGSTGNGKAWETVICRTRGQPDQE